LPTERTERFAHEFFVGERAIDLGGIDERDAALDGFPKNVNHLPLGFGWAVGKAHSHAAESDRRNLQIAVGKIALFS